MRETSNLLQAAWAALLISTLMFAIGGALAQEGSNDAKVRASDRAAVAACLKIAADAGKDGGEGSRAPTPLRVTRSMQKPGWRPKLTNPTSPTLQPASVLSAPRALPCPPISRPWRWQIACGARPRSGMGASTRLTNPGRASATVRTYARPGASSSGPGLPIGTRAAHCRTSKLRAVPSRSSMVAPACSMQRRARRSGLSNELRPARIDQ
jgi:hypothetical protein